METTKVSNNASKIFEGYKALGLVSNEIPFIVRYVNKLDDLRIVTCVGRYFHSYDSKLRLRETSHAHKSNITALASDSIYVFSACDNEIYAWKHGHRWLINSYIGHKGKVITLLAFGPHLISVDDKSILRIWEIKTAELFMEMPFNPKSFQITKIFHPNTYINKILIGSKQGSLQLWNIRSQKLIFTFKGWKSEITCIEQSPIVDVVAIGLKSGRIIVHDLKQDKTVMSFYQEWGSVLSLTFRTDEPDNYPYLISSSPIGNLAIWNLEKRKLQTQMRNIHNGSVNGCKFIFHEPLLITSSTDNSVKVWCFDQNDDTGRQLYMRDGHSAPPTKIKFHGSRGYYILSSGLDSNLKCFSTLTERLNRNLGKAVYNKKFYQKNKKIIDQQDNILPPIIDFTTEITREKEWDNIAACHRRSPLVTTWSFDKMTLNERKPIKPKNDPKGVFAICLNLSACGNFVIIGYNNGTIQKFNIQSGIHRGSFVENDKKAHEGSVQGVVSDSINQLLVSGGIDGFLKFWRFANCTFLCSISFETSISKMNLHRENSLLAVADDDNNINVVDLETRKIIREFKINDSRISDMTFSPDGRWLIVAFMDCSIKTYDLPSGLLIDHFLMPSPCVSLSMSPNGDFLATIHVNDLGIYLWANMAIYAPINLQAIRCDFEPQVLDLPYLKNDERKDEEEQEDEQEIIETDEETIEDEDIEQEVDMTEVKEELINLSSLHASRWKNLLKLDIIKKRNKPKDAFEKPKSSPFFIPVIAGLEPTLDSNSDFDKEKPLNNTDIGTFTLISNFGRLLDNCGQTSNYTPIINELKKLGPSALDVEIRSLDLNGNDLIMYFLEAMEQGLLRKRDFEFLQSCLALCLRIHSELIIREKNLTLRTISISNMIEKDWERLRGLFTQTLCIINFLKNIIL